MAKETCLYLHVYHCTCHKVWSEFDSAAHVKITVLLWLFNLISWLMLKAKVKDLISSCHQSMSFCGCSQWESNPLPCSVNAQQRPFGHSVPKTVRPNQSGDVKRSPVCFYGCRFTMLNAISECFTSMGAFNEGAVAFAPGCEGSLWSGRGLFLLSGSKVSPLVPTSLFTALQVLMLAACRISCRYDNLVWILWLLVLQKDSYNTK